MKSKRNQEWFDKASQELDALKEEEDSGEIELFYFDGSGVSLVPEVPYGWQPLGGTMEILSLKSNRINILGFMSRNMKFHYSVSEKTTRSEQVVDCFNQFVAKMGDKKVTVVLDNASVHTSKLFQQNTEIWKKKGLSLYFIPPYSPELNLIEILWKFIKYYWIPLSAYQNFKTLRKAIDEILKNIGSKYKISFA